MLITTRSIAVAVADQHATKQARHACLWFLMHLCVHGDQCAVPADSSEAKPAGKRLEEVQSHVL